MKKNYLIIIFLLFNVGVQIVKAQENNILKLSSLSPIPETPLPLPHGSVEMLDPDSFETVKMNFPMMDGPFEPTWESIAENYRGLPEWLKKGKFGFWVHYGPQSAGESGDWYARLMYRQEVVYDEECEVMLKEVGGWMKINGEGVYGSKAWIKLGEGKGGVLRKFPNGQLGEQHANFVFEKEDFRFTEGENGEVYAFCMMIPEPGDKLEIYSFGL